MAGAIFGTAVFPNLYKRTKASAKEAQHIIKPHALAKAELESLKFEKSLLQEAITRIYESAQEGRIDAMERDRLLLKYKRQLAIYNEKIDALLSLVDFSELSDMRDDVVNLLEKRVTAIDQRLDELSKKSWISHKGFSAFKLKRTTHNLPPITEKNGWQQERVIEEEITENETVSQPLTEYKYKRESTSEDISEGKNAERLQKEIIEALSRLEQTGINNDNEFDNRNGASNNNNNDKENDFGTVQYMDITSKTSDKSCLRQLIKN